jgi:hypothetical protein
MPDEYEIRIRFTADNRIAPIVQALVRDLIGRIGIPGAKIRWRTNGGKWQK